MKYPDKVYELMQISVCVGNMFTNLVAQDFKTTRIVYVSHEHTFRIIQLKKYLHTERVCSNNYDEVDSLFFTPLRSNSPFFSLAPARSHRRSHKRVSVPVFRTATVLSTLTWHVTIQSDIHRYIFGIHACITLHARPPLPSRLTPRRPIKKYYYDTFCSYRDSWSYSD